MSENETYGVRLEKKIDNLQTDMHTLSNHVSRLTFINEAQKTAADENKEDIGLLAVKVTVLENRSALQDGGISMLRYLLGACGGIIVAACFWVGSSIIQLSKDTSLLNEKLTRLETDVQNYRGYK
jgi:outer membrane murein-binding lipoprotein Lpp